MKSFQNLLGISIEAPKGDIILVYPKKIIDPLTSPKAYWSVLNSFHNNKKYPVFYQYLLNSFLAKQCSVIDNGSEIPSFLHPKSDKSLSHITFTEKAIEKVMQNLDLN